ncbi:MAG TPA: FAD-dependent oxidoreductase [Pyrinomonadaceae bacterium]|jgi:sarcosine oxidase subunit beta|nr:FAD-dependent oxidoreductase [Pyrinomonadaceae bacterium]
MHETAEVVIIGGGIVGASVAFHLAERGCTDVLVVEREARQGLGSTGKATGGVRAQLSTTINIQLSRYSIDFFTRFEEATGHACGYEPAGYLFVATSEAHLAYLKLARERQHAAGLTNVELVGADDIARRVPGLRMDDVAGGSFCQTDGFIAPLKVLHGFMERATKRGVRVWTETEVTGIDVAGGRVARVATSRGQVGTRVVVNASGAWAAETARLAGVEIPVVPLRRQLVSVQTHAPLPAGLPMVIDMSDGFHFRPESRDLPTPGALMAWPDDAETPGFKTDFDPGFTEKVFRRARARAPFLADATVNADRCRAGLYEVTPDHHAIIGESPQVAGLFLANGFSGHGVMHSPATGRIVSELILDGRASLLDARPLGIERFAKGQLLAETSVL